MMIFITELKWDFITLVRSNDGIGERSFKIFQTIAEKYKVCIDKNLSVLADSVPQNITTKGVVYLGSEAIGK